MSEPAKRMRCWRAEHGKSVPQKALRNLSTKYNLETVPLNLYKEECDCNNSLKDLNSFDSVVQSNSTSSSKTIQFQLGMIDCLKETVFIDQTGHVVPCKVKAVSSEEMCFWQADSAKDPKK